MKKIAIAAVALLTSLASCSNDDVSPGSLTDAEVKGVYVKMENAPRLNTRSDAASGVDQKAVLTTGVVVFVNSGMITRYVNISTTGATSYTAPTTGLVPTIDIATLSVEGVRFTNIKADKVYIIGNRTAGQLRGLPVQAEDGKILSGSKMTDLIKDSDNLLDITDPDDMGDGSHTNVPLYGVNTLTKDPMEENDYKTTVVLAPIVARLEIKEIVASDITFDLCGIFINNYYAQAQVDAETPTTNVPTNNQHNPDNYLEAYQAPTLRDWSATCLGAKEGNATDGFSIKPLIGPWGYNVFAAKNLTAEDKNLPRIVLRMKNVKDAQENDVKDGSGAVSPKFITVKGFNNGSTPITEFKPGYVYSITKISFNKSNLTDEPELDGRVINAEVTVSVRSWINGGDIYPEI